jgi:hypothetical protein
MTLSDWLDLTPSDLMERALPGMGERSYGDLLRTTPSEWLAMMYAPFASQTAWPTTQPSRHRPHRHRHHDCGCGRHHEHHHEHHGRHHGCAHCGPEPCECFCCLGDVDIAVYTRLGERRVVPITVENDRRREKEITLELSGWTTRGGNVGPVQAAISPTKFTLAPCSEQVVTLLVDVQHAPETGDEKTRATDTASQERLPDVDSCQVVTADLRLVGCDHRSVRIAVAILPRDCDPFRVGCGCTCC